MKKSELYRVGVYATATTAVLWVTITIVGALYFYFNN